MNKVKEFDPDIFPKQKEAWSALFNPAIETILYGGGAGGGKVVSKDSCVLTPFGYKNCKDLKVGDAINHPSGEIQKIVQLHPWVKLPKWTVYFSDGTKLEVAKDHLWQAWKARKSRKIKNRNVFGEASAQVIETQTLKEWLDRGYNPQIPITNDCPFNIPSKEYHRVDPYLIGLILGDGCITGTNNQIVITGKTDVEYFSSQLKGYEHNISARGISFISLTNRKLTEKLQEYGLLGTYSDTKFIPKSYKLAPIEDRYSLIQGLMDTDGHNNKGKNSCEYTTVSKQLADDLAFVLRSLGCMVTISKKQGSYTKNGEKHECKLAYRLYIKSRNTSNLFRLPRKKGESNNIEISKRVVDVVEEGTIEGRCITVSHPNGLYITDDFIVTHNSYLGCEWLFCMCLTFTNIKCFIARKEKARLKESTLKTFWKVCQKYGAKLDRDFVYNDQKSVITFPNTGSEILLLDVKRNPSDPEFDGLGSTEFTIGFGEEVGEWDFMAYDILSTRVGRWRNDEHEIPAKMLLTCNPKKNWVYTMFYKPWTKGELPSHLAYIPSLVTDNPKIDPQYLDRLKKLSSEAMKQKLLYGNWDYDESPNDLVDYESITNIFTNEYVASGKKYITADVARFGKDKTVIRLWDGLRAIERVSMSSSSVTQVVDSIRKLARLNSVPMSNVLVDEDGVGGGVVDSLRCKGFVSNSRPVQIKNNLNYDNLKSQCAFKIAQLINDGLVYDSASNYQETIEQELSQLKQKDKEDTKKALISKDDMKKLLNRSPDDLDNYIMRAYFELKPTVSSPRIYRRSRF